MLQISNLHRSYGTKKVLDGIDFDLDHGHLKVILGPSGCGKSTLLRQVAGLDTPNEGKIFLDGNEITHVPAENRSIAMVFQNYALYPHMTTRQNLAFPLKMARLPKIQIKATVEETAEWLQLTEQLDKLPGQMSGGQRQRVAIGRAMVKKPKLFLFDEPLSNLDAALRNTMRIEFRRILRDLKTASLYVTHDQVEAMTLADTILLLKDGKVMQDGPPREIFEKPQHQWVGEFLGTPAMNFFNADILQTGPLTLQGEGIKVTLPEGFALKQEFSQGNHVTVGIRPQHLYLNDTGHCPIQLDSRFKELEDLGAETNVHLSSPQGPTIAVMPSNDVPSLPPDTPIAFTADAKHIHIFSKETGLRALL